MHFTPLASGTVCMFLLLTPPGFGAPLDQLPVGTRAGNSAYISESSAMAQHGPAAARWGSDPRVGSSGEAFERRKRDYTPGNEHTITGIPATAATGTAATQQLRSDEDDIPLCARGKFCRIEGNRIEGSRVPTTDRGASGEKSAGGVVDDEKDDVDPADSPEAISALEFRRQRENSLRQNRGTGSGPENLESSAFFHVGEGEPERESGGDSVY